jgi:hypothetical protein
MGCWDLYCPICGNTYYVNFINLLENDPRAVALNKQTAWINKCAMLLADNTVVYNVYESDCNINFVKDNLFFLGDKKVSPFVFDEYTNHGIFVHMDCLAFVKKYYGVNLKYGDLPINHDLQRIPLPFKYGEISKYWSQHLDYIKMIDDGNIYMALSPLKNPENATRIKKIISQFKLKKEKRTGPSISATFFKSGDIKIGNNGNMWEISGGKWKEIRGKKMVKTEIIIKSNEKDFIKNMKKISGISQIGESSRVPVFIQSINSTFRNRIQTIKATIISLN